MQIDFMAGQIAQRNDNTCSYHRYQELGARTETTPSLVIVFCIDVSSSMAGAPLHHLKQALQQFVKTLHPTKTEIGIVSFATRAQVVLPLTQAKSKIQETVAFLTGRGGTSLIQGLRTAGEMLLSAYTFHSLSAQFQSDIRSAPDATPLCNLVPLQQIHKVLVMMTDGETENQTLLLDYSAQLKKQGITIVTINTGTASCSILPQLASSENTAFRAQPHEYSGIFLELGQFFSATSAGVVLC